MTVLAQTLPVRSVLREERNGHDIIRLRSPRGRPVNADQALRIASAFARQAARSPNPGLCTACVDVLAVSGAGITVMSGGQTGPVCVSDKGVAALEDLQFALGEGPCCDAYRDEQPVHEPRLDQASSRWPAFVALADTSGIGAVFAYPLMAGGAKIGVLTLYQHTGGELTAGQHDDSLAIAEVLTETVLSLQDKAPSGALAAGLEDTVAYRAEIHQASGMVSVQLRIPVGDALVRLRAHAFAHDLSVAAVAADIVTRRLRFTEADGETHEGGIHV